MKQTAVEWYEKEVNSLIEKYEAKEISKRDFITMKHNLFYPAKELEKQQIINSYADGYSDSDNSFELNKDYCDEKFKNK